MQQKIAFKIEDNAKEFLLKSFDARAMLNLLEFALVLNEKEITLEKFKKTSQRSK